MTFEEFFEFHPDTYRASLQGLSKEDVQHMHLVCKRSLLGTLASEGVAGYMAIPIGGFSLLFGGISMRRGYVLAQKLDILEEYMKERGWDEVHMDGGDYALAIGPMAVAAAVAPGAEHLTTQLAGHGTTQFIAHNVAHTASVAGHDTGAFAHAVVGGVHDQTAAVAHGLTGHSAQLVSTGDVMNASTAYAGNALGQAGAQGVEVYGAKKGSQYAMERAIQSKEERETEARIKRELKMGPNCKACGRPKHGGECWV
jgi:hypothetical protein